MTPVCPSTKAFSSTDIARAKSHCIVKWGFLVFFALVALYLWHSPNAVRPLYVHLAIFGLGPCLILLDMRLPSAPSQRIHALETAGSVTILLFLDFLLPPETVNIIGYLINFVLMYTSVILGMQTFVIKPTHWLRYDNRLHTGFLTVLIVAIFLELGLMPYVNGAGIWFLMAIVTVLVLVWRHALWNNASRELSPAQHAAVWPKLAKRSIPADFWETMYNYSLQYPSSMPLSALRVLDVSVLLSFFKWTPPGMNNDKYRYFQENIKSIVNEKEPRAIVVWQLYPSVEAANYIERIEDFTTSAQTDVLELPTL